MLKGVKPWKVWKLPFIWVKNIYSSICGTNIAIYNYGPNTGHRISVGKEFGHEKVTCLIEPFTVACRAARRCGWCYGYYEK